MNALAPAALLGTAAIVVWFVAAGARPAARVHLRFAAMLFAALAAARATASPAAGAVALLVAAIGWTVLAFAARAGFEKPLPPLPASLFLALVSLGGLAGAVTGIAAFALVPATLAAAAILVESARQFDTTRPASVQGMLAATALLAAASCFALEGAGAAHLLFAAAGLLGLTLALSRRSDPVVEKERGRDLRRVRPVRDAG